MTNIEMLSAESRRVYCAFMNRYNKLHNGFICDYGARHLPHYDGTSTEKPKYGKAITHKSGKDYKPVWPKIAKSAESSGLLVIELIRSQFDASIGGPPSANSCHGPRAIKLALERKTDIVQEYSNLFNSYKKIIDMSVTSYGKFIDSKQAYVDIVLLSKVPDICKVNILLMMQLEDLIPDNVMMEAIEEYSLRPDIYDAAWGGALHSTFVINASMRIKTSRVQLGIYTDKLIS